MHICLINNLYPPFSRGGAERVVETIAQGLVKKGHKVTVLTSRPWGRKTEEEKEGVRIIRFFPINLFWIGRIEKYPFFLRLFWHFFDVFNVFSFFQIKKVLKKIKPDLVITHNLKGIGYLIPKVVASLGIKHFHTLHDVQLAIPSGLLIKGEESYWKNKSWPVKLYQRINKKLFSYPGTIISPSQWLLDFYKNKGFFKNQKTVVLLNPISDLFQDVRELRKTLKQVQGDSFLYIGQLEKHKGILFLLEAIKGISQDFSLFIVGEGKERPAVLRAQEKDKRIKYLGKLSKSELFEKYQQADLTIVPSLCYENSPTVIYESLAVGTPVLASRLGGIPEIVQEGESGFLFEAGKKKELTDKLNFCLQKKSLIRKIKNNLSKQKQFNFFSTDRYVDKLLLL